MNTLIIVDVDDTLFVDNCKHIVNQIDDRFDYSHYYSAETFSQCVPIQPVIDQINIHLADPKCTVVFVTARSGMDDMDKYIETFVNAGLDVKHHDVIFAGMDQPNNSSTYELKRPVFERLLDSQIWNNALIYEDNERNLTGFHNLCLDRDIPHTLWLVDNQELEMYHDW